MTFSSSCASDASCRHDLEKSMLPPLESSQVIHAWAKYTLVCETSYLHSICVPSTPSHWLIYSRRRSSFIRANHMTYARTSLSAMMVPNQNSVVFYCKTTMWSWLSGTVCSHVCSRTSSCFGACYHSPSPGNLATPSRQFVLQTFIFLSRLDESGISCYQPDLNLRQIWWLEFSQDLWCRFQCSGHT